jgi:hypothetical protein
MDECTSACDPANEFHLHLGNAPDDDLYKWGMDGGQDAAKCDKVTAIDF